MIGGKYASVPVSGLYGRTVEYENEQQQTDAALKRGFAVLEVLLLNMPVIVGCVRVRELRNCTDWL